MSEYLEFKNISTILTSIFLTIFGLIVGYLTIQGFNVPFSVDVLSSFAVGVVLFIFSYYNAKHHNNLFDKDTDTLRIPINNLSSCQVDAINTIIDDAIEQNISHEGDCETTCVDDDC